MKKTILILLAVFTLLNIYAQKTELILYKQIDTAKLYMEVHYAHNVAPNSKTPAMIFFFGGGWVRGDRTHFEHHAKYFASRGLTCFLVDYRTEKKHGVDPFECVKDAKSAIRFVKANAEKFGIDSSKIIASGGSAGGHLAISTALIEKYVHSDDDLSISCKPHALVLFNPVYDNGPGGYAYERIGDEYKDFSPLHNITKNTPPTIVFFGTEDPLVPVETAKYFQKTMQRLDLRSELFLYKGQAHGFFNYGRTSNNKYYKKTVHEADVFLESLGYIKGKPTI